MWIATISEFCENDTNCVELTAPPLLQANMKLPSTWLQLPKSKSKYQMTFDDAAAKAKGKVTRKHLNKISIIDMNTYLYCL